MVLFHQIFRFISYFSELSKLCRFKVDEITCDSPYTKTFLLLQAHFSHLPLPNADFLTDTKSVLDQSIRILQVKCLKSNVDNFRFFNLINLFFYLKNKKAMIDISAEKGWLVTVIRIQQVMQCVIQARWYDDSPVLSLPNVEPYNVPCFKKIAIR